MNREVSMALIPYPILSGSVRSKPYSFCGRKAPRKKEKEGQIHELQSSGAV